ncbi:MAG TPA: hypothetical protein VGE47_14020 [Burkholderiaceae bacterium]
MKHATTLRRQRGAATLATVMILFIIIAMMAAYASRNMVFEQRIASNYYRSSLANETAESGAEWALAMLNGTTIDGNCQPSAAGVTSFRQRYLSIDGNRNISIVPGIAGTTNAIAACAQLANNSWSCQCPSNAALTRPAVGAVTSAMQPVFDVVLQAGPKLATGPTYGPIRAGIVRVLVTSCTGLPATSVWGANSTFSQACQTTGLASSNSVAQGDVSVDLALVSALKMPPASPLIVKGTVDTGGAALALHNSDPATGGLLLQAGVGPLIGGELSSSSNSLPGALVSDAQIVGDSTLTSASADRFFAQYFGMPRDNYRSQPAMRSYTAADCDGDCGIFLTQRIAAGEQLLWISGAANFPTNVTLGTAARPVVIVVDGAASFSGPAQINGVLYAHGNVDWVNGSGQPALVNGALLTAGNFAAAGKVDLHYDGQIINIVNNQLGSFVRVPGSWWDRSQK